MAVRELVKYAVYLPTALYSQATVYHLPSDIAQWSPRYAHSRLPFSPPPFDRNPSWDYFTTREAPSHTIHVLDRLHSIPPSSDRHTIFLGGKTQKCRFVVLSLSYNRIKRESLVLDCFIEDFEWLWKAAVDNHGDEQSKPLVILYINWISVESFTPCYLGLS